MRTFTHDNRHTKHVSKRLAGDPVLETLTNRAAPGTKYWLINADKNGEDMLEAAELFVIANIHFSNKFVAMNLANDILTQLGLHTVFVPGRHKWA